MFSNEKPREFFGMKSKNLNQKVYTVFFNFQCSKPILHIFFTIELEFLVQICLINLRTSILKPSETLHILRIANITKPRIWVDEPRKNKELLVEGIPGFTRH